MLGIPTRDEVVHPPALLQIAQRADEPVAELSRSLAGDDARLRERAGTTTHELRASEEDVQIDEAAIGPTVDTFAADGAIPNLQGVAVYVIGAGALASSALSADRFLTIERFWQAYLARAGADLPSARYGAALVRFP